MTKNIRFLVSIFTLSLLFLLNSKLFAENNVEMADAFRSSGKIYVVVGVIMIIFSGIFIYLVNTDNKIDKLTKNQK